VSALAKPHTPPAYVAGRVTLTAGQVTNLLALVQAQLEPNCPGAAVEVAVTADANNGGNVVVGAASRLGGPLSASNWGFALLPGDVRVYQSNFPGSSTPLGAIQVLATGAATLHVEVVS
jgi:hypothetical protein